MLSQVNGDPRPRRLGRVSRRCLSAVVAVVMTAGMATGCGLIDRTEEIVQTAIDELNRQPAAWQQTMKSTIEELRDTGSSLLSQVEDLTNSSIGQFENVVFCTTDFFGRRVSEQLQRMLHQINKNKPAPTISPVVCHTNPPEKIEAGTTKLVTYYGYNFQEFDRDADFSARLEYADGQVVESDFGHVSVAHNYQMGVEFQSADFAGVDPGRGPRLVLQWNEQNVMPDAPGASSALPVILQSDPPPRYGYEDFIVSVHADSGIIPECPNINQPHRIEGGWKIDRTKGDDGHPGISEIQVNDNEQSKRTLKGYNYQPEADDQVRVRAERICGGGAGGPGAIFNRIYRVYKVQPGTRLNSDR